MLETRTVVKGEVDERLTASLAKRSAIGPRSRRSPAMRLRLVRSRCEPGASPQSTACRPDAFSRSNTRSALHPDRSWQPLGPTKAGPAVRDLGHREP